MIFAGTAAVAGAGVLLSLALGSCGDGRVCGTDEDLTEFVDPMIGTDFTGNTYPGAQVPFGMVQLSPDNGCPDGTEFRGIFILTALSPVSRTLTSAAPVRAICMMFRLCLCGVRL